MDCDQTEPSSVPDYSLIRPLVDPTNAAASSTNYKNLLTHAISLEYDGESVTHVVQHAKAKAKERTDAMDDELVLHAIQEETRLAASGAESMVAA